MICVLSFFSGHLCELNSTSKTKATVAPQRVGQVKSRVPTGPKQNYKLYATLLKQRHGTLELQSNSDSTARLTSFPATLNMKIVFPPFLSCVAGLSRRCIQLAFYANIAPGRSRLFATWVGHRCLSCLCSPPTNGAHQSQDNIDAGGNTLNLPRASFFAPLLRLLASCLGDDCLCSWLNRN